MAKSKKLKSKVAVLTTTPATVRSDYHELMNLAGYQNYVDKTADTGLKINISWHFFYPASSTTPWQLDGVINAMLKDGYGKDVIHGCHNRTVVIDSHLGERENKHINVIEDYGLRNIHLYEGEPWIPIREAVGDLADKFLVLNDVYPDGFSIPKRFIGENIIHLPTVKNHVFTTTTGAMKNAFGGLLNEHRHWTHPVIHETLVDLLMIQKHIHKGVFAVMDGTFAGDGPGPRCMRPLVKNVILASEDQVAIDAVAAKMMGYDPMQLKYIRTAHDLGLGCGNPQEIEIIGDKKAAEQNWNFTDPTKELTFASKMQHEIYWGKLKNVIEWSLKTWMAPWAYIASVIYHDLYWYPQNGNDQVFEALGSEWGRLFHNWENVTPDKNGFPDVGEPPIGKIRSKADLVKMGAKILATATKEAPEIREHMPWLKK
jgi:uncharacterized protein (DUF362 family)